MTNAVAPRTSLGRYALVRHLASGGMADVLLARSVGIEGFERHVVLKRIREEQARDARFVNMFLDEARLAASLHHANIVQVHDIGQEDGEYFFAMEYVHGEDLRRLLMRVSDRDEQIPIDHVVTIILAAAGALHYAHEHRSPDRKPLGIVHRDVSPANIIVSYDGHVKVVDFGIAKATQRTTETHSGVMKGKVAYMSPEQCVGMPVDRRSDIFCLGIVLYELVTARRLFKGANDFLTMSSITHGKIPAPSQHRADLAPELDAIILKALATDPAARYQTADDLRVALEEFAVRAQLRTSATGLSDYLRQVFGERPLPWEVVDDDEPEMELSIDFDGSASGLVQAPEAAIHSFAVPDAQPEAPIIRARTKAITNAPPLQLPPPPSLPVAIPGPARPARNRRHVWLMAAGFGVVLAALALVLALSSRGSEVAVAEPTPIAPAIKPPPPPPPKIERVMVVDPNPKLPAVVVKKPPPKVPSKSATPPPTRGKWDPNALFPKK